jgi:hypothetical protein
MTCSRRLKENAACMDLYFLVDDVKASETKNLVFNREERLIG